MQLKMMGKQRVASLVIKSPPSFEPSRSMIIGSSFIPKFTLSFQGSCRNFLTQVEKTQLNIYIINLKLSNTKSMFCMYFLHLWPLILHTGPLSHAANSLAGGLPSVWSPVWAAPRCRRIGCQGLWLALRWGKEAAPAEGQGARRTNTTSCFEHTCQLEEWDLCSWSIDHGLQHGENIAA